MIELDNQSTSPLPPDDQASLENKLEAPADQAPDSPPEPQPEASTAQANLDDLRRQLAEQSQIIEELKNQVEERKTQYVRLLADFQNQSRRAQREKEDLEYQVKCSTLVEILPVIDHFESASRQIKPQTDAESAIHRSYQSVHKFLVEALKRLGVSPMRSEAKPFDPNYHEALLREITSEHPEGVVLEELVRGYLLGERVLRHAKVKVSAPLEEEAPASDPE